MGDDTSNTMNLDLNLSPVLPPWPDNTSGSRPVSRGPLNLEEWINGGADRLREEWLNAGADRLREAVWPSTRRRWSPRQRWQSWRLVPVHLDTRNIALDLMENSSGGGGNSGMVQSGEGSVAAEERDTVLIKTCKNNAVDSEEGALGKKEDTEKGCGVEGSFFDCNICLDLARDPVVTCCGHLFCWPCLYRWLHVHSDAKECPVCKGEVKIRNVIPIYGRGNDARELEGDSSLKIPLRPHAQRIESFRQTIQRNAVTIPVEEMIQHLGSRLDLARDLVQSQPPNTSTANESLERNLSLLNQMLTSRRMAREHSVAVPPDDVVDLTHSSPTTSEVAESRLSSLLPQRSYLRRAATISNPTSPLSSAERLVDSDFNHHPVERNQQQLPPVEDRDFVDRLLISSFSNYPVERNPDHLLPLDANRDFANRLFESAFFSYSAARNHEQPPPVEEGDFAERLLASYFRDHPEERNQEQPPPLNDRDSADRFLASYFHNHPVERNQEHPIDDRDSVSSMAAVLQSDSQTLDTATDIDSNVALSTSLSRRRNDTSRVSDRDSGDSRASRRRRLT